MVSTDGSRDDEEREDEPLEESVLPTGPTRSTYTPPVPKPSSDSAYGDDDLADAMAASLATATGSVNVVYQLDDVPPELPPGIPVEQLPSSPVGARILPAEDNPPAVPPPAVPPTPPAGDAAFMPSPDMNAVPVDLPPPSAFDEAAALASQGAPAGQPWIPERQSLRDDELAALVESGAEHPGGTLGMMEELERQMKLREEETREFQEWKESMLEVGTPEALAAVDRVLPDFSDIVEAAAPAQAAPPIEAAAPILDAPPPAFDAPPPAFTPPPPHLDAPPPSFDAPPPTFAAPPPVANDLASFPPPLVEPPTPPPSLPDAWDIQPGTPIPGSDSDFDPDTPIFIEPEPLENLAPPLIEPSLYGGDPFVDRVFTGGIPITTGAIPVITGSISIPQQELDVEAEGEDDAVDATDQIPVFDELLGSHPATAPVEPILSPRIPYDEVVLGEQELERPRVFSLEQAGLEPTPEEQRIGRSARMFWLWFAANSSIISVAFGAILFSLGLSLRQGIVGAVVGVAVSLLPLALGALAGKRSGQPTMVVSRAAFGVVGNGIPALIALVSRVFWGAVLLWFLASGTAAILVGAELDGGLGAELITMIGLGAGFLLALLIALFGYGLIAKVQLVVSVVSGILVLGLIALTYQYVDFANAMTHDDGSWLLVGTTAVLVFSFIGLVWANSSSDLARYQQPGSSGAGTGLWASFGTVLPPLLLISYGMLLAASNEQIASGLLSNPFDTIGRLLPVWYPAPLIAATALGLLCGVVVTVYSGGFALKALGLGIPRPGSAVLIAILVLGAGFLFTVVATDMTVLFRDLATSLAVPVAAWAGIFAADTMIRRRRYHVGSLLSTGGIYPTIHWVNLPALLLVTGVGFGLTVSTVSWLSWQGYLFTALGLSLDSELATTDLGVFAALVLGLLVPIITGIPGIRRQESAEPASN